jgi:hypothetical protein
LLLSFWINLLSQSSRTRFRMLMNFFFCAYLLYFLRWVDILFTENLNWVFSLWFPLWIVSLQFFCWIVQLEYYNFTNNHIQLWKPKNGEQNEQSIFLVMDRLVNKMSLLIQVPETSVNMIPYRSTKHMFGYMFCRNHHTVGWLLTVKTISYYL